MTASARVERREVTSAYRRRIIEIAGQADIPSISRDHSLNAGLTGIGYGLLLRYDLTNSEEWVSAARRIALFVEDHFENLTEAEECRSLRISESMLHSHPGIFMTQAMIGHRLSEKAMVERAVTLLCDCIKARPSVNYDATIGSASSLIAITRLLEIIDAPALRASLEECGALIERRIDQLIRSRVAQCSELTDFNFAHGWAGTLYALLRFREATSKPGGVYVRARLDELLSYSYEDPSFGGIAWPVPTNASAWAAPSWCNGAAGQVWLWSLAYRMYGDSRYLEAAESAAFFVGQSLACVNVSICCGLAGQAYALFALHAETQESMWLTRAEEIADLIAARIQRKVCSGAESDALFRGLNGASLLLETLDAGATPLLPVYVA